jgi:hypothetical protein
MDWYVLFRTPTLQQEYIRSDLCGWLRLSSGQHSSMLKVITNSPKILSKLVDQSTMPAFTLYGGQSSTNTTRVRLTLAEGGFSDYETVWLNLLKGEQKVRASSLPRVFAEVMTYSRRTT